MTAVANRATRVERVVAVLLTAGLAAVAALQLYWVLGGGWAVHAASGGAYEQVTAGLRAQSALFAVLLSGGCLLVLARVGLWAAPISFRLVRIGVWVLTAGLALAALQNVTAATDWERFANGPVALVLALLAFVVARSGAERHGMHWRHRAHPSH